MRRKINESEHLDSVEHSSRDFQSIYAQWSWRTYTFIIVFFIIYTAIFIDLEIDLKELISNGSKYLVDVIGRMLPPDFSNLNYCCFQCRTIEIAMMGTFSYIIVNSTSAIVCTKYHPGLHSLYDKSHNNYFFSCAARVYCCNDFSDRNWVWCYSGYTGFRISYDGFFGKVLCGGNRAY